MMQYFARKDASTQSTAIRAAISCRRAASAARRRTGTPSLSALAGFEDRGGAAADCGTDERALLAPERGAHARAGRRRPGDHQCRLRFRAPRHALRVLSRPRGTIRLVRDRTSLECAAVLVIADAPDLRSLAAGDDLRSAVDASVLHHRTLSRPAFDDDRGLTAVVSVALCRTDCRHAERTQGDEAGGDRLRGVPS